MLHRSTVLSLAIASFLSLRLGSSIDADEIRLLGTQPMVLVWSDVSGIFEAQAVTRW
jgi:hypothetical protein